MRLQKMVERVSALLQHLFVPVKRRMLADRELFDRVTADGVCISWDGKVEISIGEVFQLAQK